MDVLARSSVAASDALAGFNTLREESLELQVLRMHALGHDRTRTNVGG